MKARFKSYCKQCKLVATSVFGDVNVCQGRSVLFRHGDEQSHYAAYDVGYSTEDVAGGFKTVQDFAPGKPLSIAALEVIRLRMPSVWYNLFEKVDEPAAAASACANCKGAGTVQRPGRPPDYVTCPTCAGRKVATVPAYDPAGYGRLAVITQWLAGGKDVQIRRTGNAARSFGDGWFQFDGRCQVEALLADGIEFRLNPEVTKP